MARTIIGFLCALLTILGTACTSASSIDTGTPMATIAQAANETIALSTVTPTVRVTSTPPAASQETAVPTSTAAATGTPEPTPTDTPHPLHAYTIPSFQAQDFPGGIITIRRNLEQYEAFSRHYIDYPSDDLTISGLMVKPTGAGPFPVLILLHGYFERNQYYPGAGTWQAAEFFARQGYLVLAPDLRSWGKSDPGLSIFHMGVTSDVLHLISSLSSIPEADPSRVGLWGHSMGGGIATKVLTIEDRVQAAVLYAPNSADDADLIARWGPGCLPGQSEAAGDHCNPGEYIPADTSPELVEAYLSAVDDPEFLPQVAPLYHLDNITVPLQIHIGTADGALRTHTPPEWSEKLSTALQEAGVEVEIFTYPGQGHYFSGSEWTSLLERSLSLFDKTVKAGDLNS